MPLGFHCLLTHGTLSRVSKLNGPLLEFVMGADASMAELPREKT